MRKALEDGAGVALVPPADTDALAKTIADILGSPDEQARMRAASIRYSASHTFAHLARTVHELAKRHA
jgi:glycosyltransferase involved in cell wall biosynthesis